MLFIWSAHIYIYIIAEAWTQSVANFRNISIKPARSISINPNAPYLYKIYKWINKQAIHTQFWNNSLSSTISSGIRTLKPGGAAAMCFECSPSVHKVTHLQHIIPYYASIAEHVCVCRYVCGKTAPCCATQSSFRRLNEPVRLADPVCAAPAVARLPCSHSQAASFHSRILGAFNDSYEWKGAAAPADAAAAAALRMALGQYTEWRLREAGSSGDVTSLLTQLLQRLVFSFHIFVQL